MKGSLIDIEYLRFIDLVYTLVPDSLGHDIQFD